LNSEYNSAPLEQARFVGENHLRIPTRRKFVELIVALKNFLIHASDGGFKGLAWILPGEREYASEFECLRYVVDLVDITKLKAGADYDGTGLIRRPEQKGSWRC